MKKILFCIFIFLVIASLPINAIAASYVDLSRVKFSSGSEPLVFEFGSISIDGNVEQVYPFSEAEIKKLVQEALREKGLTELDIKEANQKVERAKRASEFTKEDLERVKENLFKTMEAVPASSTVAGVLKTVDDYMDSSSWDDVGTASVDLLEGQMKDWVKDTAGGFVDQAGELGKNVNLVKATIGKLTAITQFCEMMMDEHARTKQKWKDIADGANAKRMLAEFYYTLQSKIDSFKYKSDKAGWVINFGQAMDGRNFTFFGVDSNYQTWTIDMMLEQKTTNEYGSVAGQYEGFFSITAENELSRFQSNAHEAVKNMKTIGDALRKVENTPGFDVKLTTSSKGSAIIRRTISGDCEAVIEESGNITLSMDEQNDDTVVKISGITVDLKYTSKGSKIIKGIGDVKFNLWAKEEDIQLGGATAVISVISPNSNFSHSINGGDTISGGWDEEIWKPWDGTEKKLKHADY